MKNIVLCLNHVKPHEWGDPNLGKRYIGAGWIPHFVKAAKLKGFWVRPPDLSIDAKNALVIQEELNQTGLQMLQMGAKPLAVFCLEAMMYAPRFYDQIPGIKKLFPNQILYDGGTHHAYFPSYDEADLSLPRPDWSSRKEICMIASNKQWWIWPTHWDSPSYCYAIRNELHSARLQAIENHPEMDIYGPGWDRSDLIPPQWRHLGPQILKQWKGVCEDKLETLSQYMYTVCYENMRAPGYVTEKRIHAELAGCLPIYEGPKDEPWTDLKKHSNEAFARQLMEMIEG